MAWSADLESEYTVVYAWEEHLDTLRSMSGNVDAEVSKSLEELNKMNDKRKTYYAVIEGACPPAIFTSWFGYSSTRLIIKFANCYIRAVTCAFVTGHPGSKHKGFKTLEDARQYMDNEGQDDCPVIGGKPVDTDGLGRQQPHFYAVASGLVPGVYLEYQ
jgi:viroplasmin and RNaseH domain-containing protein